ncbi:syntaxin-binding protein 6 [Willisornis vidua]|uniref:Syntaxin-binding protein 6 n=1 Tax=Willisornis vidua TaxID=1566151 RepID=A0ABQ9D6D9_9PASS|nr:syntaxin-binding protein 6 [Willisornis vidua]
MTERNFIMFSQDKCEMLHLDLNNPLPGQVWSSLVGNRLDRVTNKKPAQASITKVKQFEGSTSFVRRTQWMLEQLRQVNGIDPNRDSPEFDLLFENAFDQWIASTASEKCTFFQVLHHTCQRYLTDKKPEFINCQSKIMGGQLAGIIDGTLFFPPRIYCQDKNGNEYFFHTVLTHLGLPHLRPGIGYGG